MHVSYIVWPSHVMLHAQHSLNSLMDSLNKGKLQDEVYPHNVFKTRLL